MMPTKGNAYRADQMAVGSRLYHELCTDPKNRRVA